MISNASFISCCHQCAMPAFICFDCVDFWVGSANERSMLFGCGLIIRPCYTRFDDDYYIFMIKYALIWNLENAASSISSKYSRTCFFIWCIMSHWFRSRRWDALNWKTKETEERKSWSLFSDQKQNAGLFLFNILTCASSLALYSYKMLLFLLSSKVFLVLYFVFSWFRVAPTSRSASISGLSFFVFFF